MHRWFISFSHLTSWVWLYIEREKYKCRKMDCCSEKDMEEWLGIHKSWVGRWVFWGFKTPRNSVFPLFIFQLSTCLCTHVSTYICIYIFLTWEMSSARNQKFFIIILLLMMTLVKNTGSQEEMLTSPNWM